jgi:hypothetical protein
MKTLLLLLILAAPLAASTPSAAIDAMTAATLAAAFIEEPELGRAWLWIHSQPCHRESAYGAHQLAFANLLAQGRAPEVIARLRILARRLPSP